MSLFSLRRPLFTGDMLIRHFVLLNMLGIYMNVRQKKNCVNEKQMHGSESCFPSHAHAMVVDAIQTTLRNTSQYHNYTLFNKLCCIYLAYILYTMRSFNPVADTIFIFLF